MAGKQRTFERFITCQIQISSLWLTPARRPLSLPPIRPMGGGQVASCPVSFLIRRLSDMLPTRCLPHRMAALVLGHQGSELELPQSLTWNCSYSLSLSNRCGPMWSSPPGTIKKPYKFHFVITTGYRNCISSIRWSQKYSERLAGYSECRS